eukprot:scaffold3045_cov78-Skeletonema_dohrnii-CCMP3373.AAC.1
MTATKWHKRGLLRARGPDKVRPAQMKCNRTEFVFKAFRNFKRSFIEFECSAILRPRTRILSCYISFAPVLSNQPKLALPGPFLPSYLPTYKKDVSSFRNMT